MAWTTGIGKRAAWMAPLSQIADYVRLWRHRRKTRRALLRLDERLLRDIGVDRRDALQEAQKPFWRN